MAQKMVENETLVAPPGSSNPPSPGQHSSLNTDERRSNVWADPQMSTGPQKQGQSDGFDLEYGLGMKFDDQELSLGAFTRAPGLSDAEHWSNFSNATAPLPGLATQSFRFGGTSVSPELSETNTPPSLPGPFEGVLSGPGVRATQDESTLLPGAMFRSGADEHWVNGMDDMQGKRDEALFTFSGLGPTGTHASFPPSNTLPPLGHGHDHAYNSYLPHLSSFVGPFPHAYSFPNAAHLGSGQQSTPPPTAASISSSSSGSSTPFATAGNGFERPGWKPYADGTYPSPPHRSDRYHPQPHQHQQRGGEWRMDTCDPRGITTPQEEEHNKYGGYLDPNDAGRYTGGHQLSHHSSPAFSDHSLRADEEDAGPLKRGRGRPRRSDPNLHPDAGPYFASPKAGSASPSLFKAKKKSTPGDGQGQETLGMGWDDVDEKTLEFTSRQDAKPTRTLRRQCYNCRTWRDVSAWRRSIMEAGRIVCNKCGLYEKAHKKSRPLNDRGEFVRPGKHVPKASGPKVAGRSRAGRAGSRSEGVLGAGVMRFENDGEVTK